jgi:nucleotide-binding universal stress UspA family protein
VNGEKARHPGFEHHPSDDVVQVAEEIGAGLIVLGSRGRGGVRRALMGSVSNAVVQHAHCPVMVVRPEKGRVAERQE